ncbi:class I SAM-dependent methyltransferase [Zeaxanthinibacter enoshimensis]|uniref:Methyltransferase family protein n=1 Tax=Zeaxanthinibacter enoshimensis TaxID=392009 RepID=A0A4R6TLY7_9FLAO|nr:class I SAM-dependent methyltransferase [Zeaxanthinibacter enoshimensis]TDQ30719.1 methyltransferase family protein [Zeaxanthinibacter enoshimensis]
MKRIFRFFLNVIPRPWLIKLSYLVKPFMAVWLRGSRYMDPIDGKRFRSFLPYGYEHPRENVLSPSTLSLERHRLLWLYLKEETDFFSAPLKVLHFAPEQAFYKRFRKLDNLEYTTTDLNSPLADVKADICNLPFDSDSFDVILCNHVLEHIPDDKKAIGELYRVMKKGGWGVFQVPQKLDLEKTFEDPTITDKAERAKIFGQYDHVRVYGRDYFDILRQAGFKVSEIDLGKRLSREEIDYYRLAKGEIIPLVQKL